MAWSTKDVTTALTELMSVWRFAAERPKAFSVTSAQITSTTHIIELDIDGQSFTIQVTEQ